MFRARDLGADRGEPLLHRRSLLLGLGGCLGERVPDQLFVAVDAGELVEDGMFEFLAWEPFAGAGFAAVLLAAAAGVVVVAAAVAIGAHADVGLAAATAAQKAGEEEVAVVAAPFRVLAALAQDRLCFGEGEFVDERLVHTVEDFVVPADLAGVGGIVDDPVHGGVPPAGRGCGCAFVAELLGDRAGAEPLAGVKVEDAADDRCLHGVGNEHALLVRERIAERWAASEPAALLGAAFDPCADAVDDGGVLELGEHGQHLQHHPARCRARVERLRRRTQDNIERVQLFGQLGELADLAREPVDAVDEQQVDRACPGELERRL